MYRAQFTDGSEPELLRQGAAEKILIVVPCLNESAHIASLLTALVKDTEGLDRLIVVADGGSSDGTPAIATAIAARERGIRVIDNPKRLQSAGVNLALRMFGEGFRWLVRLDAHAVYPTGYVQTLVEEARRTGAASVVVAMRSQGNAGFQRAAALVQNSALGAGGAAHRRPGRAGFVDHGHHALFDIRWFGAVGGYEETISHNEDAEFDLRLARAGGSIWLTRAVDIGYFPRSTAKELFRQYVNYGRGRAATILRHSKPPKLRQILPSGVLPALVVALFARWLPVAAAPALVWIAACLIFGAAIALRARTHAAISTGFAAMTIHLGWSIGFWSEMAAHLVRRDGRTMVASLSGTSDIAP